MLHYSITAELRERATQGWVGIWKPRLDNKGQRSWVRSQDCLGEWGLWAGTHTIPAKGSRPRIVLIGESVARGFLYDHFFTPAQALRSYINAEVIDLARSGMSREHLELMVQSSAVLEPDLVVIFAGNNWAEDGRPLDRAEGKAAAEILRQGGVLALKQHLAATLQERARQTIAKINEFGTLKQVRILWVIPTANYENWRFSECTAPLLEASQNTQWFRSQDAAAELLRAGKFEQALEIVGGMMELDQGTSATSAMLAAECESGLGHKEAASRWFRVASDAQAWDLAPQNPRILPALRELFITETAAAGAMAIDAEEIISGPSEFLDYCHLTADGISKVFWKVAELASARLGVSMAHPDRESADTGITPELEARACLLAAVHAAHYGQSAAMIRNYLEDALEHWPDIGQTMSDFLKMQIKQAPMWMCSELAFLGQPSQLNVGKYLLFYAAAEFIKLFDAKLVAVIRELLLERGSFDFDVDAARIREDGIRSGEWKNLLEPRYAPSYSHPDWWWWTAVDSEQSPRRHYLAAHTPSAVFTFVAAAGQSLLVKMVARMAAGAEQGNCRVLLNGEEFTRLDLGAKWISSQISLPGERIRVGVNQLEIVWPDFSGDGKDLLERAAREFEDGEYPELLCERAHIHSLAVSEAG